MKFKEGTMFIAFWGLQQVQNFITGQVNMTLVILNFYVGFIQVPIGY